MFKQFYENQCNHEIVPRIATSIENKCQMDLIISLHVKTIYAYQIAQTVNRFSKKNVESFKILVIAYTNRIMYFVYIHITFLVC